MPQLTVFHIKNHLFLNIHYQQFEFEYVQQYNTEKSKMMERSCDAENGGIILHEAGLPIQSSNQTPQGGHTLLEGCAFEGNGGAVQLGGGVRCANSKKNSIIVSGGICTLPQHHFSKFDTLCVKKKTWQENR